MRSKVAENIAARTYRKLSHEVSSYAEMLRKNARQRFHSYFSWQQFNIGVGFCKTTGISGWKYMLSFDLGFYSCWIFFVKS